MKTVDEDPAAAEGGGTSEGSARVKAGKSTARFHPCRSFTRPARLSPGCRIPDRPLHGPSWISTVEKDKHSKLVSQHHAH